MSEIETERYGPDEDAEYLSVFWGILRVPVTCTGCGTCTRSPCHAEDGRRLCGACYRVEMWPPEPRAGDTEAGDMGARDTLDPPPSAPAVERVRGKGRRTATTAPGQAGSERRGRGVPGREDAI